MTESKGVLTHRTERNKAFDKIPGVAGTGYYIIGHEPGYIDLYMTNEESGKRYDDEAVEFGFNSLEDAAKYVNVVMGKTPKEFRPRFGDSPLRVSDTEDIHYVQLSATAMENLKNLIEEENIQVIPYSLDDFIVRAPKSVFDKIKKKYNLLSTVDMTKRYDRYDLTEPSDNGLIHQLKGKTFPKTIQSKTATGVGYSVRDLLKYGHANRRDNYQNKYNNQDYWENDMNIYEQLNKINDQKSLSEKYNVKNAKELKKLIESLAVNEYYYDDSDDSYYDEYGESEETWNWEGLKDDIDANMSGVRLNNKEIFEYTTTVIDDSYIHIVAYIENDDHETASRYEADLVDMYGVPEYSEGVVDYIEDLDWEKTGVERIDGDINEALSDHEGTKKCHDKATKILSELEAENFTEAQVVTVCRMIEDLVKQRKPEYKTPRQKLKNAFPEFNF